MVSLHIDTARTWRGGQNQTCDVFVMSSVMEGLGTALLEAMACAKPIVATRVGGVPEVVADGETGVLVPPRDGDALAGAILALLTDESLARQVASAGYQRVQRRFSAERMVRQMLDVYLSLSNGPKTRWATSTADS